MSHSRLKHAHYRSEETTHCKAEMPPKSRGSRRVQNEVDHGTEEVYDIISVGDNASDTSSVVMTGRRRRSPPPARSRGRAPRGGRGGRSGRAMGAPHPVPDVYRDMLAEALPAQSGVPERPLKKRRTGKKDDAISIDGSVKSKAIEKSQKDDGDVELQEVVPTLQKQTTFNDSGDDSEDSEFEWEAVGSTSMILQPQNGGPSTGGDLELTISNPLTAPKRMAAARRKAITKAERTMRLEIHKMHVLCLLVHVDMRNEWCNDTEVQKSLKPLLNKKMRDLLHPQQVGTQFGISENFKKGLTMTKDIWKSKFRVTKKGARQALWAEKEEDLQNVCRLLRNSTVYIFKIYCSMHHSLTFYSSDFRMMSKIPWRRMIFEQLHRSFKAPGIQVRNFSARYFEVSM